MADVHNLRGHQVEDAHREAHGAGGREDGPDILQHKRECGAGQGGARQQNGRAQVLGDEQQPRQTRNTTPVPLRFITSIHPSF